MHATPAARAGKMAKVNEANLPVTNDDLNDSEVPDNPSIVHMRNRHERKIVYYMRLIEHELPQLTAFRKPFVPPAPSQPLVVRSIYYGGEEHPATRKRVIVVPVARLGLKSNAAIHKLKLLAGPRWSPQPPKDSGIGHAEHGGQHGYIKISCEDFPEPAMNLKWASDTLDELISTANDPKDTFADIPLDTRHLDAKARKAKKGDHVRGRGGNRPTIKDFPQEWLPTRSVESSTVDTP
ncbi:37S ribosomal protein S24, mitochondrial [Phanerochaete sordida]|uniref:37S ribosomal protein S24, mitochondrial n=1 Tax=Phanerochaete sordida TaxID=48140 RepID=A0A9P3FYR6_9APHY|nr:37S ribosomal protein S24, mitochondrial [Phanerochaete sordida]